MPEKTVPLSARLTAEDAAFLTELEVEGASTASDKVRAVVRDARRRHSGGREYSSALRLAQETLAPALRSVREAELELGVHSELMSRVGEWLPELVAFIHSAPGMGGDNETVKLCRLEAGVALRVMTLMQSVLQMAVIRHGPFYDPELLGERVQTVLDLAQVVRDTRQSSGPKPAT